MSAIFTARRMLPATIFCLGLLPITGAPAYGQSMPTVRLTAQNQKLSAVLEDWQAQSGMRLLFANSLVDSCRVSLQHTGPALSVLHRLLQTTPFEAVSQGGNLWVIAPKSSQVRRLIALAGAVFDAQDERPLEGAEIFLLPAREHARTDSLGHYRISQARPGRNRLRVKRVGYEDYSTELVLSGEIAPHVPIALTPKNMTTPEVLVEAQRLPRNINGLLAQQTLSRHGLTLSALSRPDEVFEILQQQPGVSHREADDVFPHVEGGSASEVGIELDGVPIFVPTYSRNRRSLFSATTIDAITLHRSGYGASLGGAMSGFIALHSREIREQPYRFYGGLSTNGFGVGVNHYSEKIAWSGLLRRANVEQDLDFHTFSANDLFNKFEFQFSPQHRLTLLSLAAQGSLTQSNSFRVSETVTHSSGLRYDGPGHAILLYHSALQDWLTETGFKLDVTHQITSASALHAGAHAARLIGENRLTALDSLGEFKYIKDTFPYTNARNLLLARQKVNLLSPYFSVCLLQPFWSMEVGARVPTIFPDGRVWVEPRVQFTLTPAPAVQLTLAAGDYHQFTDRSFASEAKSGDSPGAGEYVVRAEARSPSRAGHWRGEISYRPQADWALAVAGFKKQYDFAGQFYLGRINYHIWQIPLAHGHSSGVEFWLGKVRGLSQGWLSYTHSHARYVSADGTSFQPYFNRERILNLAFTRYVSSRVQFKWHYSRASGYPVRAWDLGDIEVRPNDSAEELARAYFSETRESGSRAQLAFGLSWLMAGSDKPHTFEAAVLHTHEEQLSGEMQGSFRLWLALHFAK
ncbi:carboxypeptidase-like regulatory domain-containing protein [bacterium]|nr:carboxypeptidase-like regulatory domain-containing protein [bacterium]